MNANAFSTSREAGDLVIQITLCVLVAFIAIHWAAELWAATRPCRSSTRLRLVHRAQRDADVRNESAVADVRELRPTLTGLEPCERARQSGVDELSIDDLSLWAQRVR